LVAMCTMSSINSLWIIKMLTLVLHENSLLTINRELAVFLHPCRDLILLSAGSLPGFIYALEKL
jgi:hypothetical protein